MRTHRRIVAAISWALACGSVLAASPDAIAGSRFETGEATPVRAAVRMDFTIIIPELLALTLPGVHRATETSLSPWSVAVPALLPSGEIEVVSKTAAPSAIATGNAGTIAFAAPQSAVVLSYPVPEDGDQQSAAKPPTATSLHVPQTSVSLVTHPAVFLIAMP